MHRNSFEEQIPKRIKQAADWPEKANALVFAS